MLLIGGRLIKATDAERCGDVWAGTDSNILEAAEYTWEDVAGKASEGSERGGLESRGPWEG
jgi:hypothetical protein